VARRENKPPHPGTTLARQKRRSGRRAIVIMLQRVLRAVVPAALLFAFVVWMVGGTRASREGGAGGAAPRWAGYGGRPDGAVEHSPGAVATAATQAELERCVGKQLAAFRRNDYAGALGLTTRAFRSAYSPAAFAEMTARSYPEVAASRRVLCRRARCVDDDAAMGVMVLGRDGSVGMFLFTFFREDGAWRIARMTPFGRRSFHPRGAQEPAAGSQAARAGAAEARSAGILAP
jgi:hypothetical protein